MEELIGRLVMVNPKLGHDPVNQQGEIGIITSADLPKDEIYVGFANNRLGLYSTDALLMMRRPNAIYADILKDVKKLATSDFKMLMEIVLLQEKNSVSYLRDAMEMALSNEKILDYSMVSMQEAIELKLGNNWKQSESASVASADSLPIDNQIKRPIIDPTAFDERVGMGKLPTITIEGHTFYVDLRMDKLRPKDDFLSNGIVFSQIEDYFNDEKGIYIIPYDPQKKEFVEIDYESIVKIPEHLIVIEIPSELKMDPIGWNRLHGYDIHEGLDELGLQMNFTAKAAKWEDIFVPQKIKENLENLGQLKKGNQLDEPTNDFQDEGRKNGRRK